MREKINIVKEITEGECGGCGEHECRCKQAPDERPHTPSLAEMLALHLDSPETIQEMKEADAAVRKALGYPIMGDIGMPPVIFEVNPDMHKVYFEGNKGRAADDFELADLDDCLPQYASEGDSGFDVRALRDYVIPPGKTELIKLGFRMQIPRHKFHDFGYRYECQCRPRSGISMKTALRVANAPGTIDNFYGGEVGVLLTNTVAQPGPLVNLLKGMIQYLNMVTPLRKGMIQYLNMVTPLRKGLEYILEVVESPGLKDLNGNPCEMDPEITPGSILIRKGERVAQLVFAEVCRPAFQVGTVDYTREGFGHTGTK